MKLIIDTDPGTDDAVAILVALANFDNKEILGITTVAGNVPVEVGTKNALRILEFTGRAQIPVYEGCSKPMSRELVTAEWVHGTDGLNNLDIPTTTLKKQQLSAVDFITKELEESTEKITIGVLGPMTNIGTVIKNNPSIVEKIQKIVFMGGSALRGNTTPVAEFNTYVDPEAAKIVLNSGIEIYMLGLDVTNKSITTESRKEKLKKINNKISDAMLHLMTSLDELPLVKEIYPKGTPVHDLLVSVFLVDPSIFTHKMVNVEVEVDSELTLGQTVVDSLGISDRKTNVNWIYDLDSDEVYNVLFDSANKLK